MVALDCILIVDGKSVRLRGRAAHSPQASIFCHQIDFARASNQHTAGRKVVMPAQDNTAIPSDRIRPDSQFVRRAEWLPPKVSDQSMRGDGAEGGGIPSFAGRQIQHRPGGACETRLETPGAGATIPEAERILRRDRRRNSRFARTDCPHARARSGSSADRGRLRETKRRRTRKYPYRAAVFRTGRSVSRPSSGRSRPR